MIDQLNLIGPRVLVVRDTPEEQIGSIVIPQDARTPMNKVIEGTVVKVGTGKVSKHGVFVPMSVAPGDRVLFGFLDGHDFEEGGKQYVVLEDHEVRAIYVP